jgi:hypothetical protein
LHDVVLVQKRHSIGTLTERFSIVLTDIELFFFAVIFVEAVHLARATSRDYRRLGKDAKTTISNRPGVNRGP